MRAATETIAIVDGPGVTCSRPTRETASARAISTAVDDGG